MRNKTAARLGTRGPKIAEGDGTRTGVTVEARGVKQSYDGAVALKKVTLKVEAGEFCTLLGPSGSGKTTLLRILSGLLTPTDGQVFIDAVDVTSTPVQDRQIGFVFQSYALFPHLTVAQNIAYPLRIRGIGRAERDRLVGEALDLVALEGMADRRPDQLSGGQQQRVAVARALVFRPKVLLLDEPLGALDRGLRQQLGADLRRIQQETGTTAIYVTHDQEEAFILSDTVVVMNDGDVLQMGAPAELYGRPSSLFVARFLGDTNLLRGSIVDRPGGEVTLDIDGVQVACRGDVSRSSGTEAVCSLRPEEIQVFDAAAAQEQGSGWCAFGTGTIEQQIFLGSRLRLMLRVGPHRMLAETTPGGTGMTAGSPVVVGWPSGAPALVEEHSSSGTAKATSA